MKPQLPHYDVLYIGNYTQDTIVTPAGVQIVDGGAVNYAAHAGAALGFRVAVVTRLAREDWRVVQKLTQAGVDCYPSDTPQSTCIRLDYPTTNPDVRTLSVASTAGSIGPAEVAPFQARAAVIGTTLRGEVGLETIQALREKHTLLAADVQGFVRVLRGQALVYEPWDEMAAVLSQLDVLKTDAVEAEFLTGQADLYQSAQALGRMGPREIVLTHQDGLLIYAQGKFHEAGFYPQALIGRSGRGDTCLGAYVAMRLTQPPPEAGIWAAAMTSLKMEALGPFSRSIGEVERLIQAKYRDP